MNALEERRFRLHAEQDDYRQRIQRAVEYIESSFDQYDTPYVSLSGGKDSTVLYHLVTQQCGYTNVDVYHFDWGLREVPGIESHIRNLVNRYGGELIYKTSEKVTDEQRFANNQHDGIEGLMGWAARLTEERGWDAALLGIRAQESPKRAALYDGSPPSHDNDIHPTVAPIHHLTAEDVWSYIVQHELPYHDIYDEQGRLFNGIDTPENRLVTIYDHEFESLGSEAISQFLFPSETNELKDIEQQ